jgi:hypothetical protein
MGAAEDVAAGEPGTLTWKRGVVQASVALAGFVSLVTWVAGQSSDGVKIEVMGEGGQSGISTTLYTITGRGGNSRPS